MKKLKKLKYVKDMQNILSEELQNELVIAVEAGNNESTKNIMDNLQKMFNAECPGELNKEDHTHPISIRGKTLLHLALEKNHKETALLLLSFNNMQKWIDQPDNFNITPLMLAIEKSFGSIVKILMEKGANLHIREKRKNLSPLLKAISIGNMEIIELLLSAASIKDSPWILSEALHHAVREGQYEIVKLLIEKYQAPNLPDMDGSIVLHWAIFGGNQAIIQEICNHFGNEMEQRKQNPDLSRYIDQCRIIKRYGHIFGLKTKIKVKMPNSKNYIHVDTVNVHVARDLKEALLEYGRNGDPSRTFQDFTKTLRDSKLKEIMESYMNPETRSDDKKIYLDLLGAILAKCLVQKHNLQKSLDHPAFRQEYRSLNRNSIYSFREPISFDLKNAKIILDSLNREERHEIIETLTNEKIDILSTAIINKDEALIRLIADNASQVGLCFRLAAKNNQLEILKFLINNGNVQKINEADEQGHTALFLAVVEGHPNIAEFLISQGANPNLCNRRTQETPLTIAKLKQDRSLLEILSSQEKLENLACNVLDSSSTSILALKN